MASGGSGDKAGRSGDYGGKMPNIRIPKKSDPRNKIDPQYVENVIRNLPPQYLPTHMENLFLPKKAENKDQGDAENKDQGDAEKPVEKPKESGKIKTQLKKFNPFKSKKKRSDWKFSTENVRKRG